AGTETRAEVLHSKDAGASWKQSLGATEKGPYWGGQYDYEHPLGIEVRHTAGQAAEILAWSESGDLFRSTNGGRSWSVLPIPPVPPKDRGTSPVVMEGATLAGTNLDSMVAFLGTCPGQSVCFPPTEVAFIWNTRTRQWKQLPAPVVAQRYTQYFVHDLVFASGSSHQPLGLARFANSNGSFLLLYTG